MEKGLEEYGERIRKICELPRRSSVELKTKKMAEIEEHEALEQVLTENEAVEEVFDFVGKSDDELLSVLKKLSTDSISVVEQKLDAVKDAFFERYNAIKNDALQKFIEAGGVRQDFEFRDSGTVNEIKALVNKHAESITNNARARTSSAQLSAASRVTSRRATRRPYCPQTKNNNINEYNV